MLSKTPNLSAVILSAGALAACAGHNGENHAQIKERSVGILREVLATQSEWVKVHAAEFLLWAGYPDGVTEAYEAEEKEYSDKPQYRIGIWRVLAQAAPSPDVKKIYTDKILSAFLDTAGTDRIHAAETLAKLEISPVNDNEEITREALLSPVLPLALYTQWSVAYTSADSMASARSALLRLIKGDEPQRRTSAFSLRKLGGLTADEWKALATAGLEEPASSTARVYLLSSALVTAPADLPAGDLFQRVRDGLLPYTKAPGKGDRMEMCMALSERGLEEDIPLLLSLLENENPLGKEADDADVRAAAAYALLKILEK